MSRLPTPLRERFLSKIEKTNSCWLWTGPLTWGYGYIQVKGRNLRAHRVAYELFVGPIPENLELDHLCRVRRCVNPAHLEAVSHRENVIRGAGTSAVNAMKTHCIHGHEFTPENTYVSRNGGRECQTCKAQLRRQYLQRQSPEYRAERVWTLPDDVESCRG